jgi:hypothetical protein
MARQIVVLQKLTMFMSCLQRSSIFAVRAVLLSPNCTAQPTCTKRENE